MRFALSSLPSPASLPSLSLSLAALALAACSSGSSTTTGETPVDAGKDSTTSPPTTDGSTPADAAATCTTCPSGYTCGTANGIPVCRAADGIPLFTHVFVIVMENTSLSTLEASTNTPNLHALATSAASGTDYHGVTHPSLPNYLALVSGSDYSLACDCQPTGSACSGATCNIVIGNCGCAQPTTTLHLGDQLEAAGKTWMAYGESMGTACNLTTAGSYAARHVPFLYFDDVQTDAARCASHVVDYSNFSVATAPDFTFIAPNLTDDMHDPSPASAQNLANGDMWIGPEVSTLTASSAYKSGGLVVVVWDEDDDSGIVVADAPIPIFVLSPYAKSGGFQSSVMANHYSLLRTIEEGLGITTYLGSAATAMALSDYFPAQ